MKINTNFFHSPLLTLRGNLTSTVEVYALQSWASINNLHPSHKNYLYMNTIFILFWK